MYRPISRLLCVALLTGCVSCRQSPPPDDLGAVGPFELTERGGRTVSDETLRGKVWVASFIFTRCTAGCPQVSRAMEDLQKTLHLARRDDVRLVTFTVDPDRDQPKELEAYAKHFHADADKWLFLTGSKEQIDGLMQTGFKVGAPRKFPPDDHSTRLVVVDQQGHIRGYFEGLPLKDENGVELRADFEDNQRRLRQTVAALTRPAFDFPLLNASLNAAAGVLL